MKLKGNQRAEGVSAGRRRNTHLYKLAPGNGTRRRSLCSPVAKWNRLTARVPGRAEVLPGVMLLVVFCCRVFRRIRSAPFRWSRGQSWWGISWLGRHRSDPTQVPASCIYCAESFLVGWELLVTAKPGVFLGCQGIAAFPVTLCPYSVAFQQPSYVSEVSLSASVSL